jgi:hypothetical protein
MMEDFHMKAKALVCGAALWLGCSGASNESCPSGGQGESQCTESRAQEGRTFQGRTFQGRTFQGRTFQGTGAAVSTVDQVIVGGTSATNLRLDGTVLVGSVGDALVQGAGFVGAVVVQRDVDGSLFESTITSVQTDSQDPSGEILLYTIEARNPDTGNIENICEPDPWGGRFATPVYGSWDVTGARVDSPTQIMFGCTSGVIAKCVRWGYKPWKSVSGRSLADYHQACTRLARADYCGDGVSHTQDGTLIDLYDDLQIQRRAPFDLLSPLVFDAAWSTRGAYCMTKDRWLALLALPTITLDCKTKFLNLFPLAETSPVDSSDLCLVKRWDVSRSEVHIDNRSGINISLF